MKIKDHNPGSEMDIILKSIITCPQCGYLKEEQMPVDACQYFYECDQCKTKLKPKSGDCCVFCSMVLSRAPLHKKEKIVVPKNYADEKNNTSVSYYAFSQNKFWAEGFAA